MKLNLLLTLLILFPFTNSFAQMPGGMGGMGKGNMPSIGKVYGKILDAQTKESIPYASVTLMAANKDSVISGVLTKDNGDFALENLPFGAFRLKVSFIGYKSYEQSVFINFQNLEKDLGNIKLETDAQVLKAAEITGEKSSFVMAVDRKIYNVDKDASARGGTAADVMKNVPSVTVDADGNANLRNQATQIFVDGRPTTLTLQQIPADQIDRIEVITNPSVKFDASTTGGILNIILKKNTAPGYNGVIMGGIGTGNRYNAMANLNVKQNPFNLSLMYNINSATNNNTGFTRRTNYFNGTKTSVFNQDNSTSMKNTFHFGRASLDYNIDNRNTITLAGNAMGGVFDNSDKQDFEILDASDATVFTGNRTNNSDYYFVNITEQLIYKHSFPKQGHEWTVDMNANQSHAPSDYRFTTNNYDANEVFYGDIQTNKGWRESDMYTFQSDYINPLSEVSKLELGIRSYYKTSRETTNTKNYDYSQYAFVQDTILTNDYQITDMVNAAYVNYNNKLPWFSYQTGLRFEQSYYSGEIKNKNQKFSYSYPTGLNNLMNAIFPGIYLSKKFADHHEVQANFSRKINRPNFFQLMPFVMFADRQNYRIGNPRLTPEFTNISELNYNYVKGTLNFLSSFYLKLTSNPITNISYPISPGSPVLVNTFTNGDHSTAYGLDNTLKFTPVKKLDVTLNVNTFYTYITWNSGTTMFENSGYSYNTKLNASYKLPANLTFQVNGTYEAPRIIPQGTTKPVYFFDLTLSTMIKMKWMINFTVSDVMNSKRMGTFYDTEFYVQDMSRRRETRYAKLTVTYMFGKMDSSIMKMGKRMRNQQNGGGQDGGMDF